MKNKFLAALLGGSIATASTISAYAADRHAGYYYPIPQTSETYKSSVPPLPNTTRRSRIGFTVGLNARQRKLGYAPGYHIFAKGRWAEKMIIVAAENDRYNTIYRLRALMAALSANARTSPLFSKAKNPENLNFYDLARLAGFTKITISDGDKIAHRIDLE